MPLQRTRLIDPAVMSEADRQRVKIGRMSKYVAGAVAAAYATRGMAGALEAGPRLVAAGQAAAAAAAVEYLRRQHRLQGLDYTDTLKPNPIAFAGMTAAGYPLVDAFASIARRQALLGVTRPGISDSEIVAKGRFDLARLAGNEVEQAAANATQVGIVGTRGKHGPALGGYVRRLTTPSCSRCAILAGRIYHVDDFARHPRCDCTHVPLADLPDDKAWQRESEFNVGKYYETLSPAERAKFAGNKANAADIDGGESIYTVINRNRWKPPARHKAGSSKVAADTGGALYTYDGTTGSPRPGTVRAAVEGTNTPREQADALEHAGYLSRM